MRNEVPSDVHRIDEEFTVFDADMHVRAEDQQLLRQLLHVLLHADVALQRRDLLVHPRRERVRARGGDAQAFLAGKAVNEAAQTAQLLGCVRRGFAHRRADLNDRLVQLGLYFAQDVFVFEEDLVDVGAELARDRIDDLVFFFDADRQGGGFHRAATINVATLEPPPAVTLTSDSVDSRLIRPSMYSP